MLIDLSVKVTKSMFENAAANEKLASFGHLGTHFDVMNKEFPLSFTKRKGILFDVRSISERDITEHDININMVEQEMFVVFYSGFIEKTAYGTKEYFKEHPQLSDSLIDELIKAKISLVGVDFAGVRRGKEHTPKDQYLADRGIFVIENLINLGEIVRNEKVGKFEADIFPVNYEGLTGLPCRVIART
ncbi:MAG: cyclase family protein [Clostridia bacterium]|nr:cyclase family protein [Clostridia bacterium]